MSRFIRINDYGVMCEDIKEGKTRQAYIDLDKIESVYERRAYDETYIVSLEERIFVVDENDFKRIISQLDIVNEEIKEQTKPQGKSIPRGNIDKRWRWVARDSDNRLFLYENKPTKKRSLWYVGTGYQNHILGSFNSYFDNVKWSDEEPTRIED